MPEQSVRRVKIAPKTISSEPRRIIIIPKRRFAHIFRSEAQEIESFDAGHIFQFQEYTKRNLQQ